MNRRTFVHSIAAAAFAPPVLGDTVAARGSAPRVDAATTLFYAPPDGRASLVRFLAREVDAPAGRLRVYDGARRLVGTAGMIRRGDALYGELWLQVGVGLTVGTELEAPGLRGVLRNQHRLQPRRRWTIHWLTVLDPAVLTQTLEALPQPGRGVFGATLASAGVRANPLPPAPALGALDHLPFLRMGRAAQRVQEVLGVPASALALATSPGDYPPTTPIALAGAGTPYAALPWREDLPFAWWRGPDGSRVLAIAVPPGGDASALGFAAGRAEMTRRVEQWLMTLPPGLAPSSNGRTAEAADAHVLVLGAQLPEAIAQMYQAVREWNSRFAYPRIVVGMGDALLTAIERRGGAAGPPLAPMPPAAWEPPQADFFAAARTARDAAAEDRAAGILAPFVALLGRPGARTSTDSALDAVSREIETEAGGTIVFNPSPFSRTDVARFPDSAERVVTDVPALGYVFVPDAMFGREEREERHERRTIAEGGGYRVRIDEASGAIASFTSAEGREWVRPESDGLNALPGAILEELTLVRVDGVGQRLVARRWSPEYGALRTSITVYDALPWVDLENSTDETGGAPVRYRFPFALDAPRVRWEIPAGSAESAAPVARAVPLRWLALDGPGGSVMVSGRDAPHAEVTTDGLLLATAAPGRARFRLRTANEPPPPGDVARLGWSTEAFRTARVARGPTGRLPRFGSLVVVDQPGVALVGLKSADVGDGVVVYLQELLGAARFVSVGAGLLGFGSARVVDLLERDAGRDAMPVTEGVFVEIPSNGVVALRLDDVRLRLT